MENSDFQILNLGMNSVKKISRNLKDFFFDNLKIEVYEMIIFKQ